MPKRVTSGFWKRCARGRPASCLPDDRTQVVQTGVRLYGGIRRERRERVQGQRGEGNREAEAALHRSDSTPLARAKCKTAARTDRCVRVPPHEPPAGAVSDSERSLTALPRRG
jgi:hypothetical protein